MTAAKKATRALIWLRRDLRLSDQTALHHATRECDEVIPAFVIDRRTLAEFEPGVKPAAFFFDCLLSLRAQLRREGKELLLLEGDPTRLIPESCRKLGVTRLYFNKDYEPAALSRDMAVTELCHQSGIDVKSFKDHVLFEEREILNGSGAPYRVFTPYKNACFAALKEEPPVALGAPRMSALSDECRIRSDPKLWKKLQALVARGRAEAELPEAGERAARRRLADFLESSIENYREGRNLPAISGTARISYDLRAGTLSPRTVWMETSATSAPKAERDVFLSELCWRDFFISTGFNFPHVFEGAFNRKYDRIEWRNDLADFQAWCEGRTGYPLVDAGMRELVTTGFMHNRVRMITAMFLVKDLLIDWRWGERFFRQHLMDADLSVNNGNWQWAASTGCDAQPYFRIFNPIEQGKRWDREGSYIRRHVPELAGLEAKTLHRPHSPIVDHSGARLRCLKAFKRAI